MPTWWDVHFPEGQKTLTIQDANGQTVEIAWSDCGSGPPLVLLHGWGSWSYSWQALIAHLSQQYRVICFDAKGYGYSARTVLPDQMGHQIIETQRIIQAICGDSPVYLVGESLGAFVALALAADNTVAIARLAVIAPPIYPQIMPNWSMRVFARLPRVIVRLLDQLRLIRLLAPLVTYLAHRHQAEIYHRPQQVSRADVKQMLAPYFELPNSLTPLVEDTRLAALELVKLNRQERNLIQQLQSQLVEIQQPTLILWGAYDQWFPASDGERLHATLPNAQLQILPDCGHHASGDCAAAVGDALLAFGKLK